MSSLSAAPSASTWRPLTNNKVSKNTNARRTPPCNIYNFTSSRSHTMKSLKRGNLPQLRDEFMELGVIMVEGHLQLRNYGAAVILGH